MFRLPLISLLSSCLAIPLLVSSCGEISSPIPQRKRVMYQWHDDGGPGKVAVRISLTDQIADIERSGRPIGWCYVATGKEGHGTQPGTYSITEKIVDKHSTRYGWIEDGNGNVVDGDATSSDRVPIGQIYVAAPMPYWMRLTSKGIGMHGGLIPEPGKPASHGCIRLPKEFAPTLFDAVNVGTPVTISYAKSKQCPAEHREPLAEAETEKPTETKVVSTRPMTPREAQNYRATHNQR